ncbi:MAG: hypothetical protein LC118_13120 [Dehalococcoidia bacterium]|nr:hypothetical protein [Dehalococcoidia bacterium]
MVRRLPRALAAPALAASLLVVPLLGACGGNDNAVKAGNGTGATPRGSATSGTASSPNDAAKAPMLTMPASRFAISLDDLGLSFITNVPDTFVLNADNYGASKTFTSAEEGKQLLSKWGYLGGYETGFRPEGGEKAVLQGSYYINIETHLFQNEDGAKAAYDYFESRLKSVGAAQPVNAEPLGNKSSAWKLVSGKIAGSTIDAAFHRFLFRRGNLVTVIQTYGADSFMTAGTARGLAAIVDAKALGTKQAIEPTPTSNFQTPTPEPKKSASPAASSPAAR